MNYPELQLLSVICFAAGEILLIFKRKWGWLFRLWGIILISIINYRMALYFLLIPCGISFITSGIGFFKWKKDDNRSVDLNG